MAKLFEKPEDLGEYLFRITDNGGATIDRYTIVFSDGDYYGLSGNPSSPIGFSQSGEGIDVEALSTRVDDGEEVDLALGDLEPHIVNHILSRINEAWQDYLDELEIENPSKVAKTREDAKPNDGLYNSAGHGIYRTVSGYKVRQDGNEEDDLGPYTSKKEAFINTLPTHYSLSGPEYHSTVSDVCSMDKTNGADIKVAELEARTNEDDAGPKP
jgi:hypothetical protein